MPNLPITHVLADGSEFKMTQNGKCLISPTDGTEDTELNTWQMAVLSVMIENRELLKRVVKALEGRS